MSSITRFFTTTFTVIRQRYTGSISQEQTVGSFDGHIQQLTAQDRMTIGEAVTMSHRVWCAPTEDVNDGDTLVGPDGVRYSVSGKEVQNVGGEGHIELLVDMDREMSA